MIDMGMREQHRVDALRAEREGAVIEFVLGLRALEHAAIDEHARTRPSRCR